MNYLLGCLDPLILILAVNKTSTNGSKQAFIYYSGNMVSSMNVWHFFLGNHALLVWIVSPSPELGRYRKPCTSEEART